MFFPFFPSPLSSPFLLKIKYIHINSIVVLFSFLLAERKARAKAKEIPPLLCPSVRSLELRTKSLPFVHPHTMTYRA